MVSAHLQVVQYSINNKISTAHLVASVLMVPVDTISTDINILYSVRPVKILPSMFNLSYGDSKNRNKRYTRKPLFGAPCTGHVTSTCTTYTRAVVQIHVVYSRDSHREPTVTNCSAVPRTDC